MAEGGESPKPSSREKITSSLSVDENELHRTRSIKDIWTLKKKIPRQVLEQELITCKDRLADLQVRYFEENRDLRNAHLKELENARVNSNTVYEKLRETNAQIRGLKEENAQIKHTKREMMQRFETLIKANPFSVYISGAANVQVGDNNTLNQSDDTGDQMFNMVEEILEKITCALKQNMEERRKSEMQLRDSEIFMKEFEESAREILSFLKSKEDITIEKIYREIESLELLTSDRSDEHIIACGINQLRSHLNKRIGNVPLPLATEIAIRRLTNRLGSLKVDMQQLAEELGVDMDEVITDTRHDAFEQHLPLVDIKSCEAIFVHWIKQSPDNDASMILRHIDNIERRFLKDMMKQFEEDTLGAHHKETQMPSLPLSESPGTSIDEKALASVDYRGQDVNGMPDKRSKLMHRLEVDKCIVRMSQQVHDLHRHFLPDQVSEEWSTNL